MQVVTAADLKNRLGSLFDVMEHDPSESVLIEQNKRSVAMLLNPQIAEHAILGTYYAQGVLTRAVTMRLLRIDWYGDLLRRRNSCGILRPQAFAEDTARMHADANFVLAGM